MALEETASARDSVEASQPFEESVEDRSTDEPEWATAEQPPADEPEWATAEDLPAKEPADASAEDPSAEEPVETTAEDSAQLGGPSNGAPSTGAPVSTADILARMGHTGLLEEVNSAEEPTEPHNAPFGRQGTGASLRQRPEVSGQIAGTSDPLDAGPAAEPADENAIEDYMDEDYMDRLLARVRGEQGAPPPPVSRESHAPITESPLPAQPEPEEEPEPKASDEYLPRRVAPEQLDSLAAMRALANDSTRSAIALYAGRSRMNFPKLPICGALVGVTASVVAFVTLADRPLLAVFGIVGSLTTAAVFGSHAPMNRNRSRSFAAPSPEIVREDEEIADETA